MEKKAIKIISAVALLCALLLLAPASFAELLKVGSQGQDVLCAQMRLAELDYFNVRPTGVFGAKTRGCVVSFQEFNEIMADGSIGDQSLEKLFSVGAVRRPILAAVKIPIGPPADDKQKTYGVALPWNDVNPIFKADVPTEITDFNTGKTFKITRLGGTNHAEVACSTKEDTKVFLSVFGGEPNWSKRPVIVHLTDDQAVAASLQGMNHGEDSVEGNDLEGYCCLYFDSSMSHFNGFADAEHRSNIRKASTKE